MMKVYRPPTYEALLQPWDEQFATAEELGAFSAAICGRLGIAAPDATFSRRRVTRMAGQHRCGTLLNYDRIQTLRGEWWNVGTQIHELAHYVVHALSFGTPAPHVRPFHAQLKDAARLVGAYHAGDWQPRSHGPDFYLACQMLHRLAPQYLHSQKKP